MRPEDVILSFGVISGFIIGALITTGVALLLWERASERLERVVGAKAYLAGRTAERHEASTGELS